MIPENEKLISQGMYLEIKNPLIETSEALIETMDLKKVFDMVLQCKNIDQEIINQFVLNLNNPRTF